MSQQNKHGRSNSAGELRRDEEFFVDYKLEVIGISVSDVDTAKRFLQRHCRIPHGPRHVSGARRSRAVGRPSSRVESWQVG